MEMTQDYINQLLRRNLKWCNQKPTGIACHTSEKIELDKGKEVEVFICSKQPTFLPEFDKLASNSEELKSLRDMIQTFSYEQLGASFKMDDH